MFKNKYVDIVTWVMMFLGFIVVILFMFRPSILGIYGRGCCPEYIEKLFDDTYVHTIDIQINEKDWQSLLDNAINEEYVLCNVLIDGVKFSNIGIRAKGNSSLMDVVNDDTTDRYSLKLEFDHFDKNNTCYGLDKLALNNMISDKTYMKEYLVYDMMRKAGVDAPYTSYINITLNGKNWGLYLGVECIEDSFLNRVYGKSHGVLYKPEVVERGNVIESLIYEKEKNGETFTNKDFQDWLLANGQMGGYGRKLDSKGADLVYKGDKISDYANIFNFCKTAVSEADKHRLIKSLKSLSLGKVEDCIDIEQTLRYFVAHNFVDSYDGYTGEMVHNYYLYEKDGVMTFLPWDYNEAFGGLVIGIGRNSYDATEMVNMSIDDPLNGIDFEERPMWGKLIGVDKYREKYHKLFNEFIIEYFDSGYFDEKIDAVYIMIRDYVNSDSTAFYTIEEFDKAASTLKEFCHLRAESIKLQLDDGGGDTKINASHVRLDDMGAEDLGNFEDGFIPFKLRY